MLISIKHSLLGPSGLILLGVIISGVGAFWAAYQQANFEQELRVRSDKIADLSQNALSNVTGGDSFIYIEFMDVAPGSGQILAVHEGKYPVYDVNAHIFDLDRHAHAATPEAKMKELRGVDVHIGNLTPGTARGITLWNETIPGRLRLNVFFHARNGRYIQQYRRVKVEDGWATAVKIDVNGKVVSEKISDKYPRNSTGEVDWE